MKTDEPTPQDLQWLFLPSKEPPEGSCWVKLKAKRVLVDTNGEREASAPPQNKMEGENNNLHPNSQLGKNAWQLNSDVVYVMVMMDISLLCLFHTFVELQFSKVVLIINNPTLKAHWIKALPSAYSMQKKKNKKKGISPGNFTLFATGSTLLCLFLKASLKAII